MSLIHVASQPFIFQRKNYLAHSAVASLNTVLEINASVIAREVSSCAVHWTAASWHLTTVRLTVKLCSAEKVEGGVLKKHQ